MILNNSKILFYGLFLRKYKYLKINLKIINIWNLKTPILHNLIHKYYDKYYDKLKFNCKIKYIVKYLCLNNISYKNRIVLIIKTSFNLNFLFNYV